MARSVSLQISLRLDDPTSEPRAGHLMDERAADQKPRHLDRVERQLAPLQPARPKDADEADDAVGLALVRSGNRIPSSVILGRS